MSFSYRVIDIDVGRKDWKIRELPLDRVLGPIDAGIEIHFELESWKYDVFDPRNAVVIGTGVFAGSKLFGVHRLVAVFRSPESRILHVAAMGGAGYRFIGCGAHAVSIVGKAEKPTMIFIEGSEKGVEKVEFVELDENKLWEIYSGYGGKIGAFALEKWIIDSYWSFIERNRARPVVVGPASFRTIYGALVSVDVDFAKKDLAEGSEDFAARGGPGSVLARAHNVVAIVAGGSWKPSIPRELQDVGEINKVLREVLGEDYGSAVSSATVKYRYDPKMGVGGTFGVNYPHYRELLPLFNYNSVYLTKDARKKIVDMLLESFWKPFKEEVFEKEKIWKTCGEPCPAACKKVWRGKKVDYEPFHGLGPFVGIMKLEEVAKLVDLADQLGFDAIGIGHVVAWILEAVYRDLLKPEEVGIDRKPILDPLTFSVEAWASNAQLVEKILKGLVEHSTEILKIVAENGIRKAAKILDERFADRVKSIGRRFEDLVVYLPYGEDGYMTPNYYWAPGFISPIYVTGRYWTNYEATFAEPEDFAKKVLSRALKEYEVDNAGMCRFHRRWGEKVLQKLYELYGVKKSIDEHAKEVYRKLIDYAKKAGYEPRYWESERAKDIVVAITLELGIETWVKKFFENREQALKEWWDRFDKEFKKGLGL